MKFDYKSRNGFTLIELLVVIGILAVLAAIAIPSVAGLIDRANVSADKTNTSEYTNALERFASEYELFKQDIASGTFNTSYMDSAQSRVYNVLGVEDRDGITSIEVDADAIVADDQIAIYRDTKYPANAYTTHLIVQNYTKASSSTFEPKQSDMHYWYSPDCGVVVFAEPNANTDIEKYLNSQIQSGQDAKGNQLDENTQWIDLTSMSYTLPVQMNTIPEGGTYYTGVTNSTSWASTSGYAEKYIAGEQFPSEVKTGDMYIYNGYVYRYNYYYNVTSSSTYAHLNENQNGWGVKVQNTSKSSYPDMLDMVNKQPVTTLYRTFESCRNMTTAPHISKYTKELCMTFYNCTNLTNIDNIKLTSNLKTMSHAFCYSTISKIPDLSKATNLENLNYTFLGCKKITSIENFKMPNSVTKAYRLFYGCTGLTNINGFTLSNSLTTAEDMFWGAQIGYVENLILPESLVDIDKMFCQIKTLSGKITINSNPTSYSACFSECDMNNIVIEGKCDQALKQKIINTYKSKVTTITW